MLLCVCCHAAQSALALHPSLPGKLEKGAFKGLTIPTSFESPDVIAGATLRSGPRGDCLLHIPVSFEMPAKASPCARLLYVQRPVFFLEASGDSDSSAIPPGIRNERSLEAQASITVIGGTILAADGDLVLPWLGQLSSFFAIGNELHPCKL